MKIKQKLLNKQKLYKIDLTKFNIDNFCINPFVTTFFDYKVIGKAKILQNRKSVIVTYINKIPEYKHKIEPAYIQLEDDTKELVQLTVTIF